MSTLSWSLLAAMLLLTIADAAEAGRPKRGPLDPRGEIHVPIGIPNTLDALKTFVEAEGCFSPGFGTHGIYFWVYDHASKRLVAATMDGVACERGLATQGRLIPWSRWRAGHIEVKSEVCQVKRPSPAGEVFVVGARVFLTNRAASEQKVSLYVALRPLGPAGGPVRALAVAASRDALLVDGHPALVSSRVPSAAGAVATDTVGLLAADGKMPTQEQAESASGDCSGALRFDLDLKPGETQTLGFVCPVLPGRRAVGHQWDGVSQWAQLDLAKPNPTEGGTLQPDPGLAYYRALSADTLFDGATAFWQGVAGHVRVEVPDRRWAEALTAILSHVAIAMNEGAPDVAVVNYNVFNRDGVYTTNILQKSGCFGLAAEAIDYLLAHPFNGRIYPEADNPGQILWVMGEHWRFTRDKQWLERVYPSVRKLVALIRYYRTTPEPHWVALDSLDFGDALPKGKRQRLVPGRCDGKHPEYTEAFDIAGLRAACLLAEAAGEEKDARAWRALTDELLGKYDRRFGGRLPKGYGSYCTLWPCRLYPLGEGKAFEQFREIGATKPGGWRYFPLAKAHQGLLSGNREAGWKTITKHLDHPQMQGWYAFDEGGKSGSGGWRHARTTWNPSVAMPHGWAVAELWLLLRDSLLVEDGDRLVLFAGVPPEWFLAKEPIVLEGLSTWCGLASIRYNAGELTLAGTARPPGGFVLRLPEQLGPNVAAHGVQRVGAADFVLPPATRQAKVVFSR